MVEKQDTYYFLDFLITELRSLKSQLSKDNFIKDLVDKENNAMKFVIFVASCANEFENSPDKPPDFQACIDEIADKLNQELLAYEDTFHDDVCGTSKTWLQKLRIVAIKGMLKGNENQYLEDCIQCLSNTISSLEVSSGGSHQRKKKRKKKLSSGGKSSYRTGHTNQLATAHCLRAFCFQQKDPSSKQVLEDIKIAIGLWVKIVTPNGTSEEEHFQASNNMINLLHSVTDLLSVKSCMMDYQPRRSYWLYYGNVG
ncbi:separase [Cannabis sativa]|uniref:separase n=1 Tax=Cannabis sativa TaxID=3483 RepID=UPI0029C9C844|nr:separase [Cannabis sativa]XP_060960045.1 separase [Cannabis sativa]XP_060960046.1 separase [Cannabis sativa]